MSILDVTMNDLETANLFKAISDENRIKILKIIGNGEKCACHILDELDITQPTLSHHLRILSSSGILTYRKEKNHIYFKISTECIEKAKSFLEKL